MATSEGPRSPEQPWPCQRMSVICKLTGDPVALPSNGASSPIVGKPQRREGGSWEDRVGGDEGCFVEGGEGDRKSTRLNSSHL